MNWGITWGIQAISNIIFRSSIFCPGFFLCASTGAINRIQSVRHNFITSSLAGGKTYWICNSPSFLLSHCPSCLKKWTALKMLCFFFLCVAYDLVFATSANQRGKPTASADLAEVVIIFSQSFFEIEYMPFLNTTMKAGCWGTIPFSRKVGWVFTLNRPRVRNCVQLRVRQSCYDSEVCFPLVKISAAWWHNCHGIRWGKFSVHFWGTFCCFCFSGKFDVIFFSFPE